MVNGKKVLALVPARGGSKGLPNKNILPLLGHPLIAYSIRAGLECPLVDRTVVTTDSEAIAAVARQYGAEVPFLRPAELAADLSRDLEVFVHALHWLAQHEGYVPDLVVQLRPTSPIRFAADLTEGIRLLAGHPTATSLRAVTPSPITPFKMWWVDAPDQPMRPLLQLPDVKEPFNEPRQHLPRTYWQTGTLDILRRETLLEAGSMTGGQILPYVIDNQYAVDIDDLDSFQRAAQVMRHTHCVKFDDSTD
jgi:N-acylneuraminate cytidylyltransferase